MACASSRIANYFHTCRCVKAARNGTLSLQIQKFENIGFTWKRLELIYDILTNSAIRTIIDVYRGTNKVHYIFEAIQHETAHLLSNLEPVNNKLVLARTSCVGPQPLSLEDMLYHFIVHVTFLLTNIKIIIHNLIFQSLTFDNFNNSEQFLLLVLGFGHIFVGGFQNRSTVIDMS